MRKNKIDMEEVKVKVVEVWEEKEEGEGKELIGVMVEIEGGKIGVWSRESKMNGVWFDIERKI